MLEFDTKAFKNDVYTIFKQELDEAIQRWETEVYSGITYSYFKMGAKVTYFIKNEGNKILAELYANNFVLADTYGTGSLMDESANPWFAEYKAKYWHSARFSKTIVGRAEGSYTDIFGKARTTSGRFKGVNIEGRKVYDAKKEGSPNSNDYYISPRHPSYALKLAWEYLDKQWLNKAYSSLANKLNYAKYLKEVN